MVKGVFIVFEGGEGTGKTTQIRLLQEIIKEHTQKEVLVTWEPGGTRIGEKLREVLLDPETGPMSPRCEALLYAAARAEHVEKVILPALEAGTVVLCDRYWDASRAYQGVARNLGIAAVDLINNWGTHGLEPDRVFLFDVNVEVGLSRAFARTGTADRVEQEGQPFHERVRQAYLDIANLNPQTHRVIDASREKDKITEELWSEIQPLL